MYSITYVSSACVPFTPDALRDLLAICDNNNRAVGITGMLLYKDGNFMQVLEGIETDVLATHSRIAADTRHKGLITLLQGPVEERSFAQWSMGFKQLDASASLNPAYSEFLNSSLREEDFSGNPGRARKLLMMFRKTM